VSYDAVTFMFHEFWPDIHHGLSPANHRGGKQTGDVEKPAQ
jgi:hypothetical protein